MRGPHFVTVSLVPFRWVLIPVISAALILAAGYGKVHAPPGLFKPPPLLNMPILIDPGHGGIDPGCHRDDVFEKEIALKAGLLLDEALSERGAQVVLTRTEDTELSHLTDAERTRHRRDLRARILLADRHRAQLILSLHVNSAASSKLGGAMVFYYRGDQKSKALGRSILRELRRVVPGSQNRVLAGNYYILRNAPTTAVLVEMGFITHPQDRRILEDKERLADIAQAIAKGVEEYARHAPSVEETATDPPNLPVVDTGDFHTCPGGDTETGGIQ